MKNFWYLNLIILFATLNSCVNEPLGKADPSKVIHVNSELYNLIEKAAGNDFENKLKSVKKNPDQNLWVKLNQSLYE